MKRGRGRPRKYPPKEASDFESTKYPSFFNAPNRKAEENKNIKDEIPQLVQKVFDDLYNGNYKDKLFSSPKSVEEEPILNNIKNIYLKTCNKNGQSQPCPSSIKNFNTIFPV